LAKVALSKAYGNVNLISAENAANQLFPGDGAVKTVAYALHTKSKISPLTTTVSLAHTLTMVGWSGFIAAARGNSAWATLLGMCQRIDNIDAYGNIKIVNRTDLVGSSLKEPAFVGQAGSIPITSFTFASQNIQAFKLAAITTVSREAMDRAYDIAGTLEKSLIEAMSQQIDKAMLTTNGGLANVRPAGLLSGVAAATTTGLSGQTGFYGDIKRMLAKLGQNCDLNNLVLLLPADSEFNLRALRNALGQPELSVEIDAGKVANIKILFVAHMNSNNAVLLNPSALAMYISVPEIEISEEATLAMSNANTAAPTMSATSAQPAIGAIANAGNVQTNSGIAVAGSTGAAATNYYVCSLWQENLIGIRLVTKCAWKMIRPTCITYMAGANW
jgi:HK97 family phage major capsid protein